MYLRHISQKPSSELDNSMVLLQNLFIVLGGNRVLTKHFFLYKVSHA